MTVTKVAESSGTLYFHSPCFDGVVSAALAAEYLAKTSGWNQISFRWVNYHLRGSWLGSRLEQPCGVVDFLYHPDAIFWADHHVTSFLSESVKTHFRSRLNDQLFYDAKAPSCATVLWPHIRPALANSHRDFGELVYWAERIDSARYENVQEAVSFKHGALKLNLTLAYQADEPYCVRLVQGLRSQSVPELLEEPDVLKRYETNRTLLELGIDRFKSSSHLSADGIAEFDVDSSNVIVNRYLPFLFYPDARYSAGILRHSSGAKVTIMRNPWLDFQSAPLGRFCEQFGGGGHERVGSIAFPPERAGEAVSVLHKVLAILRSWEHDLTGPGRPDSKVSS